jgi:hypothetical protein
VLELAHREQMEQQEVGPDERRQAELLFGEVMRQRLGIKEP